MTIIYALVLLGILIFVHELGHFIFAKMLGVKVLKFSLGFGPTVVGRTYGETEYVISAIPLGGYVKMLGQEDLPQEENVIPEAEKYRAFNFQPVWKRFTIVLAGPLFNLFFAALVFFLVFMGGVPYLLPQVGEVTGDSPAALKGLIKGDDIIEINGASVKRWEDMTSIIHDNPGKELKMKVGRGGSTFDILITPQKRVIKDIFGQNREVGLIGITPSGKTGVKQENLAGAVKLAVSKTWELSALTMVFIVKLLQNIIPANTIGGPIMIFDMAGKQAAQGAMNYFTFMAVISINLGVMNILPIPMLDGGHLLFMAVECVRGKPLSDKALAMAQRVGLALLVALMVFALYNDILRLVTGKMLP